MLETIHEYATEKLKESGEYRELRASHAAYFLTLAEEAEPEIEGPDQVSWLERLEAEHDNLRAALSWSLESGDSESALRIGGALWVFWIVRGHSSEGQRWLAAGLSGGEAAPVSVKARALLALGDLRTKTQGDYALAVEDLEASLQLYREAGDQIGEAYALCFLGWIAMERNDLERAEGLLEESLALSREAGAARAISLVLNGLSGLADYRGDYKRAAAMLEECLSMAREAGDIGIIAISNHNLGWTAARTGEYGRAETLLHEAQETYRKLGQGSGVALANSLLGFLALSRNDPDRAEALCVEAIRELQELADIPGVVLTLDILAGVAAARGEIRTAARLWGAATGSREATGAPWLPDERELIESHIDTARTQLDEADWTEAWEEGRAMTLEDAIAYALEDDRAEPAHRHRHVPVHGYGGQGARDQPDSPSSVRGARVRGAAARRPGPGASARAGSRFAVRGGQAVHRARQGRLRHMGLQQDPVERVLREPHLNTVHSRLGETAREAAFAEGQAMNLEEALAHAMKDQNVRGDRAPKYFGARPRIAQCQSMQWQA